MSKNNWWREEGFASRVDWEKHRAYSQMASSLVSSLFPDPELNQDELGSAFEERIRAFIETEIVSKAPDPEKLRATVEEGFRSLKRGREIRKAGKAKEKARQAAMEKAIKENSLSDYLEVIRSSATSPLPYRTPL